MDGAGLTEAERRPNTPRAWGGIGELAPGGVTSESHPDLLPSQQGTFWQVPCPLQWNLG